MCKSPLLWEFLLFAWHWGKQAISICFDPLQRSLPTLSTWLLFNHFRKLAESQCITTMFFIAGAKFSHRLFSAGTFHLGQVGAFPMWGISTSALWDSFWTQISTVLTPRGEVQAVYWGKWDMIKSVGFSKFIQMTEGIKKDSSSQAGRQW